MTTAAGLVRGRRYRRENPHTEQRECVMVDKAAPIAGQPGRIEITWADGESEEVDATADYEECNE